MNCLQENCNGIYKKTPFYNERINCRSYRCDTCNDLVDHQDIFAEKTHLPEKEEKKEILYVGSPFPDEHATSLKKAAKEFVENAKRKNKSEWERQEGESEEAFRKRMMWSIPYF